MQIARETVIQWAREVAAKNGDTLKNDPSQNVVDLLLGVAKRAAEAEHERLVKEFDRLAEPGFGFYDIHEPSEIIRAAGITKEQA